MDETLYYSAWKYNRARILQRIEKLVFDYDGAIVSSWKKQLDNYHIIPRYYDHIDESGAIDTNYNSYIEFIIDGRLYYLQLDDNFLFDHYFDKIPIDNDLKIHTRVYCTLLNRDFIYDCLFGFDCSDNEIKEITNLIFNQLLNSKDSKIYRTRHKKRDPISGGYRFTWDPYEKQYFIIKEA